MGRSAGLAALRFRSTYDAAGKIHEGLDVRLMIYRKHVHHPSRKNFQLDLFTPGRPVNVSVRLINQLPRALAATASPNATATMPTT